MRILLDECLPARLRRDLAGCDVETVPGACWAGVKNGRLLRLIADNGTFDVFLTMDKSLPHQQQLSTLPFSIVVLRARSNRYEHTRTLMPELIRCLTELKSGCVHTITGSE